MSSFLSRLRNSTALKRRGLASSPGFQSSDSTTITLAVVFKSSSRLNISLITSKITVMLAMPLSKTTMLI